MMTSLTKDEKQATIDAWVTCGGNQFKAAELLGMSRSTFQSRLINVQREGVKPSTGANDPNTVQGLTGKIKRLEVALKVHEKQSEQSKIIKDIIGEIAHQVEELDIPAWATHSREKAGSPGVPTLFVSDLHWGEVVYPSQINNVNKYNIKIAHERMETLVTSAVHLLKIISPKMDYPGIVVPLGGDMISGNIHDELTATNEINSMPAVLDLYGVLVGVIRSLADTFGRVFLPCVSGNHGRDTTKIWNKDRHATSFDWLLYRFLAKHFENDKRVTFFIPDGPDAYYKIYDHAYLLTHGDQFRGGDGIIGVMGPIIRGDTKKRSRNSQIDMDYETMLLGHFHQYVHHRRFIINGCFPAGSKVITATGYTAIETVVKGDTVMSHDGSKQIVTNIFKKTADRMIGIKVIGLPEVVHSTPNHLVWAAKRASGQQNVTPVRRHLMGVVHGPAQWVPMDFLSPGDYVHVPFPKGTARPVDAETAWAYGLYLAEGSTLLDGGSSRRHNRICLTMHDREIGILRRFAEWFKSTYGGEPRVFTRTRKAGSRTSEFVVSPGRELCVMFRSMFGHGAGAKHLPDGALWWADDLKASLLQGWVDGDGHSAIRDDCRPTVSAASISPILAWGMFHITPSSGAWPTLAKLSKGGPRKNDSYTVHMNTGQNIVLIDGKVFFPIIERYETSSSAPVFDLEVSGEHTYNIGGIGVHNSLKGLDEYAYNANFGYEPPQQALWLTHPKYSITYRMPVYVDRKRAAPKTEWVSVPR